jgi:aryl-alcohol dehydrogenase-like predicted oxidoreductase
VLALVAAAYSLLHRAPEREVFPLCAANGISQIVWSPLGQGILTGKYLPGERPPAGTRMASEEIGWAMGRFANDDVLAAIVGASRPEQVRANAAASGVELDAETLAEIDGVLH